MAESFYSDLEKKGELDITLSLSIGGKCESLPKSRSLPSILSMESWRVKSRKKLKERNIIGSCNREDRMLMGALHHMKSRTTSQQEREQFQQQRERTEGRKRKEIDAQFSYSNLSPRSFPTMPSFGIPCMMPIPSPLADTQSLPMENTYRPLIERGWPMSSKISSILQGGSKSNSYKSHTLIVDKPQPQSSSNAAESKGTDQLASHTAQSTLVSNFNAPTPCRTERVTSENNKDSKRAYGSLTMMPHVTTKGNGPNGKSISGILYRYTKSEVCIVCVCHGSFFSPAEFVEHAGGTNMDHPLKQINVVPS